MEQTATTCAVCGDHVDGQEWHPAAIEERSDGDIRVRAFCSEACRAEWNTERSEAALADD